MQDDYEAPIVPPEPKAHADINAVEVPSGYELDSTGKIVEVPECAVRYSGHQSPTDLAADTWQWPTFFDTYARTGRIGAAIAAIGGCSYNTVYKLLRTSPEFKSGMEAAQQAYVGALHAEVQRRALVGTTRGVYYKGQLCGTYQEKSDKMLELLLKQASQEWRALIDGPRQGGTTVNVNATSTTNILAMHGASDAGEPATALDPRTMSQAERDAMRALLAARRATQALGSGPQAGILPGASEQASAGSGQASARSMPMLEVEAREIGHAATEPAGIAPEASGLPQGGRKR